MKKKITIPIIALLILSIIASVATIPLAKAQETEIKVINPLTSDGNFTFSTATASVGTRFNATVWVYNVTNLYAFQVKLTINDTLLNITNAWLPPSDDPDYVFHGLSTVRPSPTLYDADEDGVYESALVGDSIMGTGSFTGSGLLAIFELEIIYTPETDKETTELNIDNEETFLLDSDMNDIPAIRVNGLYEIEGVPIPMLKVEPSYYRATRVGETFNISIVIENINASHRMIGFQFRLSYNLSFVEVLDIIEGPFLPAFNQTPDPPYTYFMAYDEPDDPYYGTHVIVGDILMPNATGDYPGPFPEGSGVIAIITFNVTGVNPGTFDLHLFDTIIINDENEEIQHGTLDGSFELYALTVTITEQPSEYYGILSVASMKFVVQYPDGTYYTADNLGSITVSIFNGTEIIENITLTAQDFDSVTNEWIVEYQIPWNTPPGGYNFVILKHAVIDSAGNSGPLQDVYSTTFNVVEVIQLSVEIDVGSIYFLGEEAEFLILTCLDGKRFLNDSNVVTATLYKPDGTTETLSVTTVSLGLFKTSYALTATDPAGTYTLLVEISYITPEYEYAGTAIRSFLVSPTLTAWDPMITNINGTVATIETTLHQIQLNLTQINANLTDLIVTGKGEILAEIESAVGTMLASIDSLNINLTDIIVNSAGEVMAKIEYYLGTNGTIEIKLDKIMTDFDLINGTLVEIHTLVGDINVTLYDLNATIVDLVIENGEILAEIDTAIGDIAVDLDDIGGTITNINGNVMEIQTAIGELSESIGGAQSAATTTLYVTSALSAITVVLAIIILLLLRKK